MTQYIGPVQNRDLENMFLRFEYREDGKVDTWRIMEIDRKSGAYYGDCDDFAITAWYYICREDMVKFWWGILFFKVKFHRCYTQEGTPHLVLEYKDYCTDNGFRRWVKKKDMPYKFRGYKINNILMVAAKLALGKIFN